MSVLFYWCGGGNEYNQEKEKGTGDFSEGVSEKLGTSQQTISRIRKDRVLKIFPVVYW